MQYNKNRFISWLIFLFLLLAGLWPIHIGVDRFYHIKLQTLSQQRAQEVKSILAVDARTNALRVIAQRMNVRELSAGHQLELLRAVLGAEVLYILNSQGKTIAEATIHQEPSKKLLGHNYAFRPYFQQAQKGITAIYPAIGVTTKVRGFYHSTPLGQSDVLVAKFSVQEMDQYFIKRPNRFMLVSPDQKVYLASQKDWILRSLNRADNANPLVIQRDTHHMVLDSGHYFYDEEFILFNQGEQWRLISLVPAREVWAIKFLAALILVTLLFTRHLLFFYRQRSKKLQFRINEQTKFFFTLFAEIKGSVLILDRKRERVVETYGKAPLLFGLTPGQSYRSFLERYQLRAVAESGQQEIVLDDATAFLAFFKELEDLEDEENELSYCFLIDISALKQGQREKETMRQQLYHAHSLAAIGEITASIAHEIKNPLTAILSVVDLLRSGDQELPEWRILQEAAGRIRLIVESLGKSAHKDYQKQQLVLLPQEVEDAVILLERIFKKEGITIERNFCLKRPHLFISSLKFKQIVTNLLTNARDALLAVSDQREKKIILSLYDDDDHYILKVIDNGIGIPEENREKIFQTFFTTKAAGTGTGLGLGILRTILEELNGEISFVSEVGVGTTFTIRLPTQNLAAQVA